MYFYLAIVIILVLALALALALTGWWPMPRGKPAEAVTDYYQTRSDPGWTTYSFL